MKEKHSLLVMGNEATYAVGALIGKTDRYNVYACTLPSEQPGIFKIAQDISLNPVFDREAFALSELHRVATAIEEGEARKERGSGRALGYTKFFPRLVESFTPEDQGKRRALVLDMSQVCEELSQLTPIGHLVTKEHLRVDPKTSAWMCGKMLKLIHLAQFAGLSVRLTGENVLVNRDTHVVTVFDWSTSNLQVQPDDVRDAIADAALQTFNVLGGSFDTGEIPEDPQYGDVGGEPYARILLKLANGGLNDAAEAHRQFYECVRSYWPSAFHPFTAYRR